MTEIVNNMGLLSVLFGRPKLNAVEAEVLSAVSKELAPAARDVFSRQLDMVNLVQRHADGKEVNLYAMRRGKPAYDEQCLFPLRREVQLARVKMLGGSAEVWLVEGWVFSIHFNMPPERIVGQGLKVEKVEVLHDPMIALPPGLTSEGSGRDEALAMVHSKVPEEYLQLVGEGKGMRVNGWVVSGIESIRKIVQRDGNYYLLAEKEDVGAVGIKEDESSGQVYYLDYGDDRAEKISVSLPKFLEEFDGGKVEGRF